MIVRMTSVFVATLAATSVSLADSPGWTFTPAAPGTRLVYVSSSLGRDTNTGLTQQSPKQTLAAGWDLIRSGYADRLLLKRGDTWYEGLPDVNKSGPSEQGMIVVGSYGPRDMARPQLRTPSSGIRGIASGGGVSNVAIVGLDLAPTDYNGTGPHPTGIDIQGSWHNLLIEDCLVAGYANNVTIQGDPNNHANSIRVRRNVIVDSYVVGDSPHSQGLLIGHTDDALIEENVLDHNGWREDIPGAQTTIYRHNVYINPDNTSEITVRGNIVARGAASGLRCAGTYCEDNLLLSNAVNIIGATMTRSITGNVVIDSRDISGDLPRGSGIVGAFAGCEISGNILAHRTNTGTWNVTAISLEDGSHDVRMEGNTIFNWTPPDPAWAGLSAAIAVNGAGGNVVIANNEFQMPRGGRLLWCENAQYVPTLGVNQWLSPNREPFMLPTNGGYLNYWAFHSATGEAGSFGKVKYPNPMRTPATYARARGWGGTLDDYLREVRKLERGRHDSQEFFAAAAIRYISQGFGD
jgi:hypothetical protein